MTTQPTPRFTVERELNHGTVTWLRDTEDMPAKQWTIPTSLADELNRLYDLEADVIKVFEDHDTTAERYEALYDLIASKQPSPPPAPATENVPLHKVIGRTLPGESASIINVAWWDAEHTWQWHGYPTPWRPLPVDDDGTVTVLIDAPAATSDLLRPDDFRTPSPLPTSRGRPVTAPDTPSPDWEGAGFEPVDEGRWQIDQPDMLVMAGRDEYGYMVLLSTDVVDSEEDAFALANRLAAVARERDET